MLPLLQCNFWLKISWLAACAPRLQAVLCLRTACCAKPALPHPTRPALTCPSPPPSTALPQALQILDNEEEVHVPRVLVYDHVASGVSRDAIHVSQVEGRDVWWQVRWVGVQSGFENRLSGEPVLRLQPA